MMLAVYGEFPHNGRAADTNAAWFDSQNVPGRTTASRRYFYVRTQLRTFYGRAIVGRAHALPVPLDAGLSTLHSARPPHLTVGRGSNPSKEVAMRAHALARPEQPTSSNFSHQAGIAAAQSWFAQIQKSAADYRDTERCAFVRGLQADDSDAALASLAFDQGFAKGLAEAFAGVRHHG